MLARRIVVALVEENGEHKNKRKLLRSSEGELETNTCPIKDARFDINCLTACCFRCGLWEIGSEYFRRVCTTCGATCGNFNLYLEFHITRNALNLFISREFQCDFYLKEIDGVISSWLIIMSDGNGVRSALGFPKFTLNQVSQRKQYFLWQHFRVTFFLPPAAFTSHFSTSCQDGTFLIYCFFYSFCDFVFVLRVRLHCNILPKHFQQRMILNLNQNIIDD